MLKGKSVPEDSVSFYKPVLAFLEELPLRDIDNFRLRIELEYFNSNSSKFILDIFLRLAKFLKEESLKAVDIDWIVDKNDEDMIEAGEDYMAIVKLPFNIVERESNS